MTAKKRKKIILAVIWLLILALIFLAAKIIFFKKPSVQNTTEKIVDFASCVQAGYPVEESYPRQCHTPSGQKFTEEISLANNQTINEPIISQPNSSSSISSPLNISGQAPGNWFFEASFPIKLVTPTGQVLASGQATAKEDWMTDNPVFFTGSLNFSISATTSALLILSKDNPSGLPANDQSYSLPLTLLPKQEKIKIKLNFFNDELGASMDLSCTENAVISREIIKTDQLAQDTLNELLKGPTIAEKDLGFYSALPTNVILKSIIINNDLATVDFEENLQTGVSGVCRVAAIRSQITKTLEQFENIKDVQITINGRLENVLQP